MTPAGGILTGLIVLLSSQFLTSELPFFLPYLSLSLLLSLSFPPPPMRVLQHLLPNWPALP